MAHISSHNKIGNKKNSISNNDALYVYTQNNAILKGLSSITNEEELLSFCSKIKSKPEELHTKVIEYDKDAWTYSPLSDNGNPIYQNTYINFIGLAYFLNNQFLISFFEKQIENIFQYNLFGYHINKHNFIEPVDFKNYLLQININNKKENKILLLDSINNNIEDIKKYKNITFHEICDILIAAFHDDNIPKINFFFNYKNSGSSETEFNNIIKKRINNNVYYYDHKILPICVDILNLDILKDPIVLKNIGKAPIFADKILSQISYKEFKKMHKHNFLIDAAKEPHYDYELLKIFIKYNIIDDLLKVDKTFLDQYFTSYRGNINSNIHDYNDLEKIFTYLKDKHNYEYFGFYNLKNDTYQDNIYMTPGKNNKNSPLQQYILANNLKNMPDEALQHFIKTFIAQDQPDYFLTIFANPNKNITNEKIYLTFLKSFGEDKRIKYFSSENGIKTLMTWLSEDFRVKHNINVSDDDIMGSLKNNEQTNNNNLLGVYITKYLLDNAINQYKNVHNPLLTKKRL